jgi:DNA-binding beta-propeller fold protein YncE
VTKRDALVGAFLLAAAGALGVASCAVDELAEDGRRAAAAEGEVPLFAVDPLWPKPLPEPWILGSVVGVSVDARDHVWIIHRPDTFDPRTESNSAQQPPTASCCEPAPPVLEFDAEGNLVSWWGGPGEGYDWPQSNHGITVDHLDNVWIGGNGQDDSHILRFARDGTFLAQFGSPRMRTGSHDPVNFWRVAKLSIDAEANEVFVADGYGNRRVAVLDASTGEMKRYWGAYGEPPDDGPLPPYDPAAPPARQFRSPLHCADVSLDGLVYACDRAGDRIQVFQRDGTFVREVFIEPETLSSGSVWDIAFSPDPEQRFLYLADGLNRKIHVIERETMRVVTKFGAGGRQPGQFYGVHSIATDSRGNLFTTETWEGKRLQKFTFLGFGAAPEDQGVVWPEGHD